LDLHALRELDLRKGGKGNEMRYEFQFYFSLNSIFGGSEYGKRLHDRMESMARLCSSCHDEKDRTGLEERMST